MMQLKEQYLNKVIRLTEVAEKCKRRARYFATAEVVTFLAAFSLAAAVVAAAMASEALVGAALLLAIYAVLRMADRCNSEQQENVIALRSVYEDEIKALEGDYTPFDDGAQYADPRHPFTFDLDIFGADSLFQRINRTVTTGGSDKLAESLSDDLGDDENAVERVTKRRDAIEEMAGMDEWRARFCAIGKKVGGMIDTNGVVETLRDIDNLNIPTVASSPFILAMALLAIGGFWLSVALSMLGFVSGMLPLWWGLIQFFAVLLLCSATIRKISRATNALMGSLKASMALVNQLSDATFTASYNTMLTETVSDANNSFRQLEAILAGIDRRANVLGLMFFNVMFLSDFFLIRRFLLWKGRSGDKVEQWMDAVATADARVSMADMVYNNPHAKRAEVLNSDAVVYEAHDLCHPFIGRKAVANDFTIADENYYIVTGANMAGKSTFLRAVGVNYVLAVNGMSVFASSLRMSLFRIFSSMRTTDDLSHGISYFNAELLRLRQLLDCCRSSRRTLIILDEILKGTNSLDKLNGSRLFLTSVAQLPVTGIIATHDLELSHIADEKPSKFHNYCFEIELGTHVTYSYKITPGVARNQNATYLLRKIIEQK